ncbi:MAG TPA: ParB N-terminal domain-containing protein [Polyangiaceae bacterium]|nr:ParB N-terminal domain-containing protein [Polyangiaceae bacterium]
MSDEAPVLVELSLLDRHPQNPRLRADAALISRIAADVKQDGFSPENAPTVRRKDGDRYEIIIGHRRVEGAKEAGLDEIPVWIVDWSEQKVLEKLASSNDQGTLSALEIAVHSFTIEPERGKKGGGLKRYATRWGLADSTLGRYRKGATVYLAICDRASENVLGALHDRVEHLARIAGASPERWTGLVERLVAEGWSIKETEQAVSEDKTEALRAAAGPDHAPEAAPASDDEEPLVIGEEDDGEPLVIGHDGDEDDEDDNGMKSEPMGSQGTPRAGESSEDDGGDDENQEPPLSDDSGSPDSDGTPFRALATAFLESVAQLRRVFNVVPEDFLDFVRVAQKVTPEELLDLVHARVTRHQMQVQYEALAKKTTKEAHQLRREMRDADGAYDTRITAILRPKD